MSLSELSCWLRLWRTQGVGPVQFFKILDQYSSLEDYYHQKSFLITSSDQKLIEQDLAWAQSKNRHIMTYYDDHYPVRLKEIHSPPPLLFVEGDVSLLSQPQLGIVGSRHPTPLGSDTAYHFAKILAQSGLIITSGLALGIDGCCHEGALAVTHGKTIGVMGTGPDQVYPKSHKALAGKIIEQGCLVTEFPTGVSPVAMNFPRRNRIISGLSMGILVVEAAFASGSLVTAKYALEQNREIFAIPGSIQNPLSRGCHALIKQGAKLVESAQDILDELRFFSKLPQEKNENTKNPVKNTDPFLEWIGFECTPVDLIIQRSHLTAEKVSSMLLILELEGKIASVPGGYIRLF